MSPGVDHENGEDVLGEYGFARVVLDRPAGQLVAAMGEEGRWIVRIRRRGDEPWRLACTGDVDSLTVETDFRVSRPSRSSSARWGSARAVAASSSAVGRWR